MAIDFPSSPNVNDTFTSGSIVYTYDGTKWTAEPAGVSGGTKIEVSNTKAEIIDTGSDGRFVVTTEGTERARVDSAGRLLVGNNTSNLATIGSSINWDAVGQFNSRSTSNISLGLFHWSTYATDLNGAGGGLGTGPDIVLARSNSDTVGTHTAVTNNLLLGRINFSGSDGTTFINGACIAAAVDGTPGANDMPGRLTFSTTADGASSPTERMRITSAGVVKIPGAGTSPASDPQQIFVNGGYTDTFAIMVMQTGGNSGASRDYIRFYNYQNQLAGSIQHNGATTVSYNTSSDYRLKENISAVSDPCGRLLQLKPCNFNFISEPDKRVDGFIAHEVQEIIPEAINGEKDGVDSEGNPVYQGIDQSKLVPLLTAALQEALTKIETLETQNSLLQTQNSEILARLDAAGI